MEKFFYGMTGSGIDRRTGAGYVPGILISASVLWNGKRFKGFYPPRTDALFVDSGGFVVHQKWGAYPFTLEQYVELVRKLDAKHAATLDFPCEPKVNRTIHATNLDRIAQTVKNATDAATEYPEVPWVPVIQGYTREEYVACVESYESAHMVRPFMAVGTLCTRVRRDSCWEVVRAIKRELPDVRLHGFGISLSLLKDRRIRRALWSADSQAWRFFDHIDPVLKRWIWKPRTMKAQIDNYPKYSAKVNRLLSVGATRLETFA